MLGYITRLTSAVLFVALLTGAESAGASIAGNQPPLETQEEDTERECWGIKATVDGLLILYDGNPKPFVLLPLLRSKVREIGIIHPRQEFTICTRVDRSTWNHRNAWLHVHVDGYGGEPNSRRSGWVTMSRQQANVWTPEP